MPEMKTSLKELEELIEKFSRSSRKKLREPLQRNPRFSLIIRLSLGLSLTDMSRLINSKPETLSQHERGKTKSMRKELAQRILNAFNSKSKILDKKQIIETFLRFKNLSMGGQKQAIKRAEKPIMTKQEERIMKLLNSMKIKFELHKTIMTSIGPVNMDFAIPLKEKTILIETTEQTRKQKFESMNLRAIKVKNLLPNSILLAVVNDMITNTLIKRLEDFDFVVREPQFDQIITRLMTP